MSVHTSVPPGTGDIRTDAELARDAEAGDPAAKEELAGRLLRKVPCWVRRWYRNDAFGDIVASKAQDRIRANLAKYNPELGAFSTWAYRVAYRAFLNAVRDLHLNAEEVSYEALGDDTFLSEAEPVPVYAACRVREELDRLDVELSTVMRLKFYKGLSVVQIARILHLTRKQVRLRMEKAMALLRTRLAYAFLTPPGPISCG